jgi:hypothetical protein
MYVPGGVRSTFHHYPDASWPGLSGPSNFLPTAKKENGWPA